ncbi:alpha/beta hydrolase [Paenarthrobacter sp. Z7-10]|uniref:alpha/beta hydrolase n=1 Tax=Paenarthrobacter sp. Z7-10 TaxID=2787635 RepID=UPI0022A9763A|nr:alpha/beta hydrolase [Paenarthrobacter sp. Z7-10]MCZ2401923.1 alpha/beta hydrolase [Paenarthrobacter sp. Z7-10]
MHRYTYGPDASQYADLYLPDRQRCQGVAVVIHGGYWRSGYAADLGAPLAQDLAAHGIVAWNLEYRRAGNGGGWPETFEDVAAGIDKLGDAAAEHGLDLSKVVALGHSAGGQLAVWAGGRSQLPPEAPGAADRNAGSVPLTAVVSQSGVLDLRQAMALNLSNGAVLNFLGGSPAKDPQRYRMADPLQAVPLRVPVSAVYAAQDITVPPSQSKAYVEADKAARSAARGEDGGRGSRDGWSTAELVRVPGDHFDLIDVRSAAYAVCRELVQKCLS